MRAQQNLSFLQIHHEDGGLSAAGPLWPVSDTDADWRRNVCVCRARQVVSDKRPDIKFITCNLCVSGQSTFLTQHQWIVSGADGRIGDPVIPARKPE